MSLRNARLPSLDDKHAALDAVRDQLDKKDARKKKTITKKSAKNTK